MGKKVKHWLKKAAQFILNPRFLLCFGMGWMITNGWSYILFGLGTFLQIQWMVIVSGTYLALLWLPFTPEKVVTVAIAIFLLRWLFPNDKNTLAVLIGIKNKAKASIQKHKEPKSGRSD